MAALESLLEDSQSAFSRLMEKHRSSRKKFLLHRLVVAARLSCTLEDRSTVAAHYEKLNMSVQRSRPGEELTGLLLLYPQHTLHVIECSTEALLSVLQDLRHLEENPNSALILHPRILLVSHDLSCRLFQQWSCIMLSESESRRTEASEEQNSDKLLNQTIKQLLRLGCHLYNTQHSTGSTMLTPDEVLKDASDVVPPAAAVYRLLQMEALLSPARYIGTYHSPIHQPLDSGHVFSSFRPFTV
ncbi:testis-expressed protein 47 isoform X2 [Danio aesculapii]|uniref:testis-expressed protein 47 isoform X2 n=1 Tax=Danio aesculapii TaxID=1142201 RepID=UPI0024BF6DBD|nr:testis-expressed protein 47 isoform X2 [Danio aesculapii]